MRTSRIAAHKAKLLLMQATAPAPAPPPQKEEDPRPEMVCFRGQTLAIVRNYFELSTQHGRVPSLMGREFFRARVSHHAIPSFEEQAVFVRDVELCIGRLGADQQEIILLAGMYNFTHEEVAAMLHTSKTSIHNWFAEALDALTEIFLAATLLSERRPDRHQHQVMSRPLVGCRKGPGKVLIATDRAPDAMDGPAEADARAHGRCG
jgi:hypothetical protein